MVKKINSNSKKGINLKFNLNFSNKLAYTLIAIISLLAITGIVYAYNSAYPSGSANPELMGHTPDELFKCPANKILKTDASGNWQCSDDVSGVTALPTCANNQVIKYSTSTNSWVCANDIDTNTDTKCNIAGACTQVCIGSTCRSTWPSAAMCTYDGTSYGVGAKCETGTTATSSSVTCYVLTCGTNGEWLSTTDTSCAYDKYQNC